MNGGCRIQTCVLITVLFTLTGCFTEINSTTTSEQPTTEINSTSTPEPLITDSTEPPSSSIPDPGTTTTTPEPPTAVTTESLTGINGTIFSGSLNISALCNESDKPGDRTRMNATLTDVFSNTPGFIGLIVTTNRSCPTISADFSVVVNETTSKEAQSDFSMTIHRLLTNQLNLTYEGQQYTVDEVTIISKNGQEQKFTSTSDPCEIYIAMEACSFGECTRVGNDLKCMNVTATTDMSTSSEYITTTELPATTSTEPSTITTPESLATSTESYNITTTEVLVTDSSTSNGSNISTETLTTPTDSFNISTETSSATTVDNSTFFTEPATTTTPNNQTTFTESSTIVVDNSSISTETTITTTLGGLSNITGGLSNITETPTIATSESLATSTESNNITNTYVSVTESSTITDGSALSTETLTTPTEGLNISTESPTSVDNLTLSTETLTTTISSIQTTFIDPSTSAVDNSSISTETTIMNSTDGLSTSTETSGTTGVGSNLSTEPSTTTVDNSSISTETTITTAGGFLNSTEPPTTPTNSSAISTETNSSSTSELPTTPSDVTTSTTEPTSTYGLNQTSDLSTISQTAESSSTTTESSVATTTDPNETSFSGSVNISAFCNQSDETGDRSKINTGLSEIFNAIPGFKRLEVPSRTCPTIHADFSIVVDRTSNREAQSNFSMTIHKLLTNQLSISYDGNQYSVDEIILIDFNNIASKFTNTSDPCVIFTAIKPCDSGSCTVVGKDLECMNITATTDNPISTEVITTTPENATTPTEPSTTVTSESSTAPTEPPTILTPENSTEPTEPSTIVTSESSTAPTEPPTTVTSESSTAPTEPLTPVTPESSTAPTEPPTTVTSESSTAPTQPPTTVTPESSTASTEPPTTVTPESSTEPTVTLITTTPESSTAPTEPLTRVTPESSTEQSTITTDPNEVTFSGNVKISASCNQSDETGDRLTMQTALTEIFNTTPGFKRLDVVSRRCGSIYADFAVVIIKTFSIEAQSKFSLTILMLLTYQLNVTYAGQQYTVDEVRITDYKGISQNLTNTSEPCEIFTTIEPCPYGNCTQNGNTLACMNMTATTELPVTSTQEITSTTELASTATTEAPTLSTTESETTSTTDGPGTPTTEKQTSLTTVLPEISTAESSSTTTSTETAVTTTTEEADTATTTTQAPATTTTSLDLATTTTIGQPPSSTITSEEPTSITTAERETTSTTQQPPTSITTEPPTTPTSTEPLSTSSTTQPPTMTTTTEPPSTTTTAVETTTTTTAVDTTTTTTAVDTTTTTTAVDTTTTTTSTTRTTQPPTSTPTTQPPTTTTTQAPTTREPTVNEPLPFGATEDSVITGDDVTSPRLTSPMTLQIGDGMMGGFNYVIVGTNGIIGLGERYNSFSIDDLSDRRTLNRRILCPFWVDLVADGDGSAVYYKVYKRENQNDATTLNRVDKIVQTFFDDFKNFKSSVVYKVTWNNMTFFADRTKRVTFQSLIVSDGRDTFSVTNYIDVNVPSTIGTRISVGYRYRRFVERNTYSNRPACFRMTQVPGNLGYNGFWVTKMTTETTLDPQEIECYNWYAVQSQRRIPNPWWLTCPCNGFAMRFFSFRFAYYRYDPIYNVMCYVSITFGQSLECCYRWGFFGLGPLSRRIPESGSVLSANPIFQPIEYYQDNSRAKEVCCASGHCDWYYALRPRPRFCLRLIPVRTAWFFGDPHINTLDGGKYTFNGYGEYTMMKIDHNGTKFDLQARTDLATNANGTTINATIFSAFVAKDHTGSMVQVEMSRTKTSMYVRGNGRDLTLDFENNPNFVFRTINVSISMNNGSIEASFIQSSITIKISLGVRFLTSETMVDETYMGKVTGLMGNFDGNTTNDFILPNGTTLYGSDVDTERKIYNNFGQLWSIDAATSLFHYDTGLTHDDYSHPEFTPFFIDEFPEEKRNKSIEVCGGTKATQACIFDYLATGDQSLAEASGADDNSAVSDTSSLENEIPSIEGDTDIKAEVNKPVEIKFNATDDGTFTYQILQEPPGFSFNNTTGIATWTPQDNNVANISVTVVDDKGEQAAPVDVSIILCTQCSGHGSCNYNNTRSSTSDMFKYAECVCDDGYSGQDCENETDGCAQSPCAQGRNCTDLSPEEERALGRGYNCSDCPSGYLLLDEKCEDINECNSTSTNLCNSATQDCENTEGSYQCNCKMGYRKIGNNCQDIEECIESTSGCEQNCTNSPGSFVCSCITGFTLNSDNKTCNGSSSCSGLNCEYACSKESGSDVCICKAGYKLKDTENCTDINECDVSGICSQGCDNSDGSYTCSCFAGYSLNPDKTTCSECEPPSYGIGCQQTCTCGKGMDRCDPVTGCVCKSTWTGSNCDQDVDECTENPNICGSDKICQNLEGSHTCKCRTGFQKDSQGNCIDIKECDNAASNNCSTDTTVCSNNIGGYTCTCKSGYTRKNFYECEDFDECTAETDGCSQKCVNVDGGFNCECEFGYTLGDDRKTCIEVQDICSLFPSLNCSYGCKKTNESDGSCFCPAGYLLNAQDQRSCVDIDECNDATLNQCNFKEKCVNIDGSYNCSCPVGYTLENDGRTCKECNGFTFGEDCKTPCNCGVGSSRCDNVRGCICEGGWTGEKCDIDKDECSSGSPCTKANEECKNSPGSYKCVCAPGYVKNTTLNECSDIDECKTNPCSQLCTNTIGSYSCSCNAGFRLVGTSQCEDIDECSAPTRPCDQICTNTQGSFRCSCNAGFSLNTTTRVTCETRTRCENVTFNCTQKCGVNLDGSEYCFCNPGFSLHDDGVNCTDIDECSPNPCSETCTQKNPGPGYACSCAAGKKLDVDLRTCIDCGSQTYGPGCSSICTCDIQNTLSCDKVNGSCTCKTGWEGENCTIDINECNNTTICPLNAECSNSNGSFSCICNPGFALANGKCVECTSTTYGQDCSNQCSCDLTNSKSCDKQNGTCYCNDGWTGVNCTEDVKECGNNLNICGANANCSEVPGSYVCICNPGYKKSASGACEDINECVLGTDTCNTNADCTNTVGSFKCTCKVGFSGDGFSCTSCNSTHFGQACSSLCSCVEANTVDCDNVNGTCKCNTGWTGADCNNDIDECTTNKHNCNVATQTCNNVDGSWNCTCTYGNSNTGCISKESEYSPESTEVKVGVNVTFDVNIDLSNYGSVKIKMTTALTTYYQKIDGFIKVVILVIRRGSTIVEHEVVTNKTEKAQQDTAFAVVRLSNGEDKVKYENQNLSTTLVSVKDKTGIVKNITSSLSKCDVYIINYPCDSGEQCIESGDAVYCSKIADDDDEFKMIVGLGVGIPLFFIAVLILAIICVYWRRRQDDDSSSLSEDDFGEAFGSPGSYFPSVIPTKIDSWGRHVSPYSPHYLSDHSTIQEGNRVDDVTNYTEPYLYDNGEKSNFSWDFMFQSLHPNEKFHIKRPGIRSQPLKTE